MKTKALLLSALILAPTAGAAAAQSASAQDFRVQTGKALAAPAQDFRVSYGSTTQATTLTIFAKSNLPQALNDEELDEVTGEGLVGAAAGAAIASTVAGASAAIGTIAADYFTKGEVNWGAVKYNTIAAAAGAALPGAIKGAVYFPW